MKRIEFYSEIDDQNNDVLIVRNIKTGDRHKLDRKYHSHLIDKVYDKIKEQYPGAYEALYTMFKTNAGQKFSIVKMFLRCNFSNMDSNVDIDDDWNFNFENVHCPLKCGICKHQNVICNPQLTDLVSHREKQVIKLLADGFTAEQAGNMLYISVHTVCNHRRNIYRKLNLKNENELTKYAIKNNITE